jgi:hypothetical protein
MKILQHIFVLILPFIVISCNSQITDKPDESLTAYYKIEIPEKHTDISTDTHQIVTHDTNKSIHKLNFGVFSTESTIEIFSGDNTTAPIIKQHLKPNQKQIVDISKLSKGIYNIQFTAIAQSCLFQLEIK